MVVRTWVIYVLSDPRTPEQVRYVGVTHCTPKSRLGRHLGDARKGKGTHHSARWLRSLLNVGLEPKIRVIEQGAGPGWEGAEIRWIAWHKDHGFDLTNHALGGQGPIGCVRSPETRAKLAAANRGKKQSPELIEKRIAPTRGRVTSPETRARMSASMTGLKRSPEACEKMRAERSTSAFRSKMSEAAKKAYAERKAKGLIKSQVGKKMSEEARIRMSEAAKARHERIRQQRTAEVPLETT
jgi:hypothetical protein